MNVYSDSNAHDCCGLIVCGTLVGGIYGSRESGARNGQIVSG